MTEKANVEVIIKGKDEASAAMGKVGKSADQMAAKFAKVGGIMMAVGGGMLAMAGKMVTDYAKAGDEIAKMAKRTGIATEALSEMRHVAMISGTSLESVEKGIKKMQRTITDADQGMAEYVRTFETLGISMESIVGKTPEEQFWMLVEALGEVEDFTVKAALAQEIFGRAGTDLMPIIDDTKESIQGLKDEAHELNMVFDEESAAAAEAQVDAMTNFKLALEGLRNAFAKSIMPIMTEFLTFLTDKLKPMIEWLSEHEGVAKMFLAIAATLVVGGALMLGLSLLIKMIGMVTAAYITMQAFMGPAGWTALIVGASTALGLLTAYNLNVLPWGPGQAEEPEAPRQQQAPPAGYASWDVYYQATGAYERAGGGPQGSWFSEEQKAQYREANIPLQEFSRGGFVGGAIGQPQLVVAHGGEYIGQGAGVNVYVAGSVIAERELEGIVTKYQVKRSQRNYDLGV